MAELFLHIGAPKTGTTAIQALLTARREALIEQRVLYPRSGTLGAGHHLIGAAIFPERRHKLRGSKPEAVLDAALAGIEAEAAAANARRIILSTEYLWGELSRARVVRLLRPLAGHDLHVVAYVRRQDLLAQSIYTQAVKRGATRSFADWVKAEAETARAGLHFDRVLACWRDCGLPVTMHVRVYERGQIDADVSRDFMGVVCPDLALDLADSTSVNTSPDGVTVELLRRISARETDKAVAERLRRRILGMALPRELFAPIHYFPGAEAAAFVDRFAEGNASVARDLLDRADGVLFREPPPAGGEDRKPVSPNIMLDRLIALLPLLDRAGRTPPPDEDALIAQALAAPPAPAPSPPQRSPEQVARRQQRRAARAARDANAGD